MISISIKKGYTPNVAGRPSLDLETLDPPGHLAVLPEKIPFIKPRLAVEIGSRVNAGSLLFFDKRNPDIKFLSPGGGKITAIDFGPRRVIRQIIIERDPDEAFESFPVVSEKTLASMPREKLVEQLVQGGLWPLIRALPFRDIASADAVPPMIWVSLDDDEPFQAAPEVYLKDNLESFTFGLNVLKKLAAEETVNLCCRRENEFVRTALSEWLTHVVSGKYPAGDPGVLLYHTKKTAAQNHAWFIGGQDVLMLARFLQHGRYPTERIVAVGGMSTRHCRHVKTRIGAPLGLLCDVASENKNVRFIVGGLFRGYESSPDGFMGFYETALTVISQGGRQEFLALFAPGYQKPTYSRVFLSRLNRGGLDYDCNRHGDERACIACMHCADVCPVDILPQMTYKAILSGEVEEYLAHGLLDCVACGLCSYVCPAKIELSGTFMAAKAAYAKEQS